MTAASFDVESMVAEAREQTGLSDFGGDAWRDALAVLAVSLDREANLHAIGRSVRSKIGKLRSTTPRVRTPGEIS